MIGPHIAPGSSSVTGCSPLHSGKGEVMAAHSDSTKERRLAFGTYVPKGMRRWPALKSRAGNPAFPLRH